MAKTLPRGIRLNNPGNIRISNNKWQGKVATTDKDFETFATPTLGIRALARLLMSYESQGFNTVRLIISKYAPSNENNTESYVQAVNVAVGKGADTVIDVDNYETMKALVKAIITHENGIAYSNYYSDDIINQALALAGVHDVPAKKATGEVTATSVAVGTGALSLIAPAVQATAPAFPLIQHIVTAAPWVLGLIVAAGGIYILYRFYKKHKETGGIV